MPLVLLIINISLILLILVRVPNTKASSLNIDSNPPILSNLLIILSGLFLVMGIYMNL